MTTEEYVAALHDIHTKRREACRIMNALAEEIWQLRKHPLGTMEMLHLSNVKAILGLMEVQSVSSADTSTSSTNPTVGGASSVCSTRAGANTILSSVPKSPTRHIVGAKT